MAWLRAAATAAQKSKVCASADSTQTSWRRIDDLGGGLFLCGAAALDNRAELDRLGIRSILNCATEDIYDRSYTGGAPLRQILEGYNVRVFEAQDVEEQPMSDLWTCLAQKEWKPLGSSGSNLRNCSAL